MYAVHIIALLAACCQRTCVKVDSPLLDADHEIVLL